MRIDPNGLGVASLMLDMAERLKKLNAMDEYRFMFEKAMELTKASMSEDDLIEPVKLVN